MGFQARTSRRRWKNPGWLDFSISHRLQRLTDSDIATTNHLGGTRLMQAQQAILKFNEAEKPLGDRLLKIALEIDRIEGYSEPHAIAIARLAEKLGAQMGLHGIDLTALKFAGLAHDLGERAMKRNYLLRPGALTWEESLDLWRHPILGEQAAGELKLSRQTQLLIRWHHEWWNGQGYPDGLAGEAIPLSARILRVADSFFALISDRPHRSRFDYFDAEQTIADLAGIEFDPKVVKLLLAILDEDRKSGEQESYFATRKAGTAAALGEQEPAVTEPEFTAQSAQQYEPESEPVTEAAAPDEPVAQSPTAISDDILSVIQEPQPIEAESESVIVASQIEIDLSEIADVPADLPVDAGEEPDAKHDWQGASFLDAIPRITTEPVSELALDNHSPEPVEEAETAGSPAVSESELKDEDDEALDPGGKT
jgi:hypothetical protein